MKLIPDELVAALLRYLSQRPYGEVSQAIMALSQLQEAGGAKDVAERSLPEGIHHIPLPNRQP